MSRLLIDQYKKTERFTAPPRRNEARVLTQAAMKLKQCQENWEAEDRAETLNEALKYNQKLWSVLQADLVTEANPLPKELRVNLLKLGAFIDKQTVRIMISPTPDKLTPIININLSLAAGLQGKTGTDAPQDEGTKNEEP